VNTKVCALRIKRNQASGTINTDIGQRRVNAWKRERKPAKTTVVGRFDLIRDRAF
jgi:hypothetical protein